MGSFYLWIKIYETLLLYPRYIITHAPCYPHRCEPDATPRAKDSAKWLIEFYKNTPSAAAGGFSMPKRSGKNVELEINVPGAPGGRSDEICGIRP